jgi:hypothetical protein
LAQSASSDFIRSYYQRTAERCLLVAEGEEAPLPAWATVAARSESSTPLSDMSDEMSTSVPEQATAPLDEALPSVPHQATAPLPDEAILFCGKGAQPQQSDTEQTPAHGRGAGRTVLEMARRVSRLALRAPN